MLEDIREKKTNRITYALVIIAGIGMLFIGVPFFNQPGGERATVATVNGHNIPISAYNNVYREIQQQAPDLGEAETKARTLRRLITQNLFQQHALDSRYILPETALYRIIKSQFGDNTQYQQWLTQNHLSAETYQNSVRNEQTVAAYYRALLSDPGDNHPLLQSYLQTLAQERGYTLYTLPRAPLAEAVSVSDDALHAYHDAHQDNYTTPEAVDIDYTLYDIADLGASDEQIAAARQASEKRSGRYIIFDDSKTAADAAAAIQAGEKTFADYWQAVTDKTTAGETGTLDPASKDKSVTPEIGEALFALAASGDTSPVIKSEYGDMLIELGNIEASTLSDDELRRLAAQQNLATYDSRANQAFDAAQNGQPLPAITGITGGNIASLKNITAASADAAWLQNPKVREQLFGEKPLAENKTADPVEIAPQQTVFFTVTRREKPQPRPFAEVKNDVARDYRNAEAEKGLQTRGEALQKALSENNRDEVEKLAREYGVETLTLEPTNRFSDNPIVPALFENPARISTQKSANGDLIIARLDSVRDGDIKALPDNIRQGAAFTWQQQDMATTYNSYGDWLYRHAKIKVNEEMLQRQ